MYQTRPERSRVSGQVCGAWASRLHGSRLTAHGLLLVALDPLAGSDPPGPQRGAPLVRPNGDVLEAPVDRGRLGGREEPDTRHVFINKRVRLAPLGARNRGAAGVHRFVHQAVKAGIAVALVVGFPDAIRRKRLLDNGGARV